jgi:hypothetical protein
MPLPGLKVLAHEGLVVSVNDVADGVGGDGDAIVCEYHHPRYPARGIDAGRESCAEIYDGPSVEDVSVLELWRLPRHRCAGRCHTLFLAVHQARVLDCQPEIEILVIGSSFYCFDVALG